MQPQFFIGVGSITIIFAIIRLLITRAKKPYAEDFKNYIARDRESNYSRKKDIPKELMVTPGYDALQLGVYPEAEDFKTLHNMLARCERASKLTMVKPFQGKSNIDLKMEFGAVNLDVITSYEDNYTKYLHSLNNLAKELIKQGFYRDAETVLHECIGFGSDLTLTFKLLADIYIAEGKTEILEAVRDDIAGNDERYAENPSLKNTVLTYFEDAIKKLHDGLGNGSH